MLEVRNAEDYTYTMDKQLARNPMLAMLFANCARQLLAGKACCVKQYMPMFSSATSVAPSAQAVFIHLQVRPADCSIRGLAGGVINKQAAACTGQAIRNLHGTRAGPSCCSHVQALHCTCPQINTCMFQEPGQPLAPALFLWFNAPSSQFDLTSQLKRNYLALATVPSMVAVFAMDGRVLHQNSE
jgi:hypothetical protein